MRSGGVRHSIGQDGILSENIPMCLALKITGAITRMVTGYSYWRDRMWLNVVLAIDERLEDVKRCVESLRKVYGQAVSIALATYGGHHILAQPLISAYADEQGFLYFDAPRQDWLTEEDSQEWQCSETLARIQITKHFMDWGYEEIYIMHSDVQIIGNFRRYFLKEAKGQWSFIGNLIRAQESFKDLCERGSWGLWLEGNRARLADILTRYNPAFVARLYAEFGTVRGVWDLYLSKFTLWGDLAQFDVAREWHGFTGRYIQDKTDVTPLCFNTILHHARQNIPACMSEVTRKGIDRDGVLRNYERRITCKI